jgi:hypothetical protein
MSDMRRDQHKASNAVCTALLEAGKIGICRGQPLVYPAACILIHNMWTPVRA